MSVFQRDTLGLRSGWILLFAVAFPLLTPSARDQNAAGSSSAGLETPGFADITTMASVRDRMIRASVQHRNALRQKAIVDDTTHLLDLARQLQAAVGKSDKDQLSLKVVDTAAEIEKLAKSVEKKMRNGD
jgi:hypothetical protein